MFRATFVLCGDRGLAEDATQEAFARALAGAIWAQQAWGRYWGWDPKETWSFITWTIYAGYLHARATSGWGGRGAAAIAMVGFVSLLVTYYVVNLSIVGLHSYKAGYRSR